MENNSETKLSKLLQNLSNYLLGATIICYLSGFAITNLYLGSLGVVNLDILRSRYILTGILFIIFVSAILYLLYGLWKIIKENEEKSLIVVIQKGLGFSFTNILIFYIAVPVIAIFAGSAKTVSPVLPQTNPALSWSQWLTTEPLKNILPAILIFLFIIAMVLLVLLLAVGIVIVINPKDKEGVKTSRREKLKTIVTAITGEINLKKVFASLMLALLGLYSVLLLSSLIKLLRTGDVTSNITTESYFQIGWSRYFISIIVVYAFIAVLLLFMSYSSSRSSGKENESNDEKSKNIRNDYFTWIYAFTPTIVIIISVYAFGVYPYLPQQIGGGRLIPVSITSSSEDLDEIFTNHTNETYLIDRAPNSSLFLIIDQPTENYKIVEVSNDLIESIEFYESP